MVLKNNNFEVNYNIMYNALLIIFIVKVSKSARVRYGSDLGIPHVIFVLYYLNKYKY